MLQGTKDRAGGLSSLSSPQDEAEIPVGSGPASGSQGGLDHSGRVWRPQQPPGRRPGHRPSEPPHKEMFVPRRRGLWAVAPLAPSSLLPPPFSLLPAQAASQTGGPDWGGRTQEEPPRAGARDPPNPQLARCRLGWRRMRHWVGLGSGGGGRGRARWSSFLAARGGHPAWLGRSRPETFPPPTPSKLPGPRAALRG